MDVDEFIHATLNADATLQGMWGDSTVNPYAGYADNERVFPYTVFQVIGDTQGGETLQRPGGTFNEWVYSFATFAVGTSEAGARREASLIAKQIVEVLTDPALRSAGFKAAWRVATNEAYNDAERAYRYTVDLKIQENLRCN